jgi:hypothetical protein
MKIPHRELESFRRNPRAWVTRRLQAPQFNGMRIRNEAALRMAVHWLHKGHTLAEATHKLAFYARKDLDLEGRHKVMQRLVAYERWYRKSARTTTHTKLYLPAWDSEPLPLGGYVDRVDVVVNSAQPMQGIFLGRHTERWREELRMPLAQHAISSFLFWPPDEVVVGVQLIDGSGPEVRHYASAEVSEALDEFEELRSQAADML